MPTTKIRSDELLTLAGATRGKVPKKKRTPAAKPPSEVQVGLETLLKRGESGSLGDRDPEFIASQLRWMAPVMSKYFRSEVRHLDRIPATGPVLCVGNHSGGLLTPDTWVLMTQYFLEVGVDRPTFALAHSLVLGMPVVGDWLRKVGTLPANPGYAAEALRSGAAVLVYPGGDEDVFRSWRERNRIHLAKRTGFVRLALEQGVPIVPVVSVGGHETALVLGDGKRIAQRLGLDKFRIKSLPMVIGPPWGVSPGDLLGHMPLPAKITVECGEPIDFAKEFGDLDARDPEVIWACYRLVEARMQTILDRLAAERHWPIFG